MSNVTQYSDLSAEQVKTLEQAGIVPPETPPAQIAVFGRVCQERGLSPFSKEIYLTGYKDKAANKMKYTVVVGINGFRKIAAETGQLAGIDDAIFDLQPNGAFKTAAQIKSQGGTPVSATVTAWRMVSGVRCPFSHTALFSEFSSGQQKWQSMPFQMIGKVAEAFALRKGFSDRLTGLNSEEEFAAMDGQTIAARRELPPAEPVDTEKLKDRISECWTGKDLLLLYNSNPEYAASHADLFTARKEELEAMLANGQIKTI